MFTKAAILTLCALTSKVLATPLPKVQARGFSVASVSGAPSFNDWPIQSLHGFDDFYGSNNFNGYNNKQVIVKGHDVTCAKVDVKIVQQRLAVIQELAKKVVTEMVCDVETQTVVWEQFTAGLGSFGRDMQRVSSGREIGYDSNIISHWGDFIGSDGSCSTDDWGFKGTDIGSSIICPMGNNWDDNKSPDSVGYAKYTCDKSIFYSQYYYPIQESCDSSSGSYSPPPSYSSSNSYDSGSSYSPPSYSPPSESYGSSSSYGSGSSYSPPSESYGSGSSYDSSSSYGSSGSYDSSSSYGSGSSYDSSSSYGSGSSYDSSSSYGSGSSSYGSGSSSSDQSSGDDTSSPSSSGVNNSSGSNSDSPAPAIASASWITIVSASATPSATLSSASASASA